MDKPNIRDAALVKMLTTLPTVWSKVVHRKMSAAQQKAIDRLIRGGLIEARVEAVGWMENFPQVVLLRATVLGQYKPLLIDEILSQCKAWRTSDGLTRDIYHCWYEILELRLSEDGEQAKNDLTDEGDLFPVEFINKGGSEGGTVRREWFAIEMMASPIAAQEFATSEIIRLERVADGIIETGEAGLEKLATVSTPETLDADERSKSLTREKIMAQGTAPIGQRLCDVDPSVLAEITDGLFHNSPPIESAIDRIARMQLPITNEITGATRRHDDALEQTEKNSPQKEATKPKWTWRQVMAEAETIVKHSGYHGHNALAKQIGCSASTLSKAVGKSTYLKARKAEYKQQPAGKKRSVSLSLSDGMIEDKGAIDPTQNAEVAEAFEELLKLAKDPNERKNLLQMDDDQRAELVVAHLDQLQDGKNSYCSR